MKNNNSLKIYFAIAMSFAVCSLKAQSLEQKFQKDMEQRKNHVNAVRVKANEQQVQQKAERTNAVGQQQNKNNTEQFNIQTVPVEQKKTEIKPKAHADNQKPVIKEQASEKAAVRTKKIASK